MITDLTVSQPTGQPWFLKKDHRILLVEITCPADANILDKEDEKASKYQALTREVSLGYY